MNRIHIIVALVAALLVAMVVFGRNPVEANKKKKATALTDKITEFNKKQQQMGKNNRLGLGPAPGFAGGMPYRPGTIGAQNPNLNTNPSPQAPYNARPAINPYAQGPQGAAPKPNQMKDQGNGYYPPPPLPAQNSRPYYTVPGMTPGQPGSFLNLAPDTPGVFLHSGQKIAFAGPKVYMVGAQGKVMPLPDGIYPLVGGGPLTMVIRGGQKQILN